jgi:hypothetical protein
MRRALPLAAVLLFAVFRGAPAFEAGPHPYFSRTASGSAMGNAIVSLPAHPSNIWANPAGLAFQEGWLFYAAPHDEVSGYREDFRDRVFAASLGRPGGRGIGLAIILRQNDDQLYRSGDAIRRVDIFEPAFFLAYGRRIGAKTAAGVSLLGYQHRADVDLFDGNPTAGLTAGVLRVWDHALRGKLPLEWRWGFAAGNIGPSFDIGETETKLPLYLRTGVSTKWESGRQNRIVGSADLYFLPREEGDPGRRFGGGIGAETVLAGTAAIRVGYVWDEERDRSDPTFGFGIGNEVYPHIGGMIEYGHGPGDGAGGDFADHFGVRVYWIP